ncbi:hypothetical protein GPJ56_003896 [Histomonas meleagridis]|uniref:uncharacterized protein n=1 Tax=Histomonas meleagridis TaxID=135588 RepID=UPI0035593EB2|nr:hypothetical protein GPJ56_003896 [Histomonas meleagridis]KAH0797561.1 hypothetical protein GO595_009664 [Histomonas meleagridis]
MKIKISHAEKEKIKETIKQFCRNFATGTMYGSAMTLYIYVTQQFSLDLSSFCYKSIETGVLTSTFELVDEVSRTVFRPTLNTPLEHLKWGVKVGLATSILNDVILYPLEYWYFKKEFNGKDFKVDLNNNRKYDFLSRLGGNAVLGFSNAYLPPSNQLGGTFARNVLIQGIGTLFDSALSYPLIQSYERRSVTNFVNFYISRLPKVVFTTSIYSITKKFSQSLFGRKRLASNMISYYAY